MGVERMSTTQMVLMRTKANIHFDYITSFQSEEAEGLQGLFTYRKEQIRN